MRIFLFLSVVAAFGQEFKPIPSPPPTTTSRGGPVWIEYPGPGTTLGSEAWPWPCVDPRIKKAKPGDYKHIYCRTKAGVLLMDGKPIKH